MRLLLLLANSPAWAAIIGVTTTQDQFGEDLAHCGLREAIQAANTNATFGGCIAGSLTADSIVLMNGTYALSRTGGSEDGNATGDLDITSNMNIGPVSVLSDSVVISAGRDDRVFDISNHADVGLFDMTIADGNAAGVSAGQRVGGGIRLADSSLLTLTDVVVRGNSGFSGGGIYILGGSGATLIRSALIDNVASGQDGGGIALGSTGSFLTMSTTTISGNRAGRDGGGILAYGSGTLTLNNMTIVNNEAVSPIRGGGGIDIDGGATADIFNSIIANNRTGDLAHIDCAGAPQILQHTLLSHSSGCTLPAATSGSLLDVDPLLTELGQFGGHTPAHHPRSTSPAINAASTAPAGSSGSCVAQDQRGKGWQGICDMGAVQWNMDFVVSRTDDATDLTPGNGVCQAAGGGCTLRAAIQEANAMATHDYEFHSIYLPVTPVTLSIAGTGESAAATGDLDLNTNINLFGHSGFSASAVDANFIDRAFAVRAPAAMTDMTIENGAASANGGSGGGIFADTGGSLFIDYVRVLDNSANSSGGGIALFGAPLHAHHCSVSRNQAAQTGGGIFQNPTPGLQPSQLEIRLTNCTLGNNIAHGDGGAIWTGDNASASLDFATVAGNRANTNLNAIGNAGGIHAPSSGAIGNFAIANSIVANNLLGTTAGYIANDCWGKVTLVRLNFIGIQDAGCALITDFGSALAGDAQLLPLDTSSFFPSYAFPLRQTSPAFAAETNPGCRDNADRFVSTDQRGKTRGVLSFGGTSVPSSCSLGAYEGYVDSIFADGFEPFL
ncbi:MAG: choice-of-anchor Q domain-containing protein [Dokdonella sp.]